jgi:hypothetical protein
MSQEDKSGGSAFPNTTYKINSELGNDARTEVGLTKREWFAGLAMQGMLQTDYSDGDEKPIAKLAFQVADAMLSEGKDE